MEPRRQPRAVSKDNVTSRYRAVSPRPVKAAANVGARRIRLKARDIWNTESYRMNVKEQVPRKNYLLNASFITHDLNNILDHIFSSFTSQRVDKKHTRD